MRIQRHLAGVEAELRSRDVDALAPELQAERARNLDRLHDYWTAGVFPLNDEFAGERVPFFIDDGDRACAVGHLVIESGGAALAERIRRGENNAKLLDMRTPGLAEWVARSGLTAQEHAMIQPAYCECRDEEEPVCGVDGHTYLNECYAVTCAMVEVDHVGACEGDTTTDWPEPGTTGDGGGETAGDGKADVPGEDSGQHDTDDHDTDDHHADEGGSAEGGKDDDGDDDKGCSIAGGRRAPIGLAVLVLAGVLRKRRR